MYTRTLANLFGVLLLVAAGTSANAAIIGTVTFRDPTGTVNSNETIDVWVTLTLDAASDPLVYDTSIDSFGGIDPGTFPTEGFAYPFGMVPFDSYNYVGQFTRRTCNDTFAAPGCGNAGSAYQWQSNNSGDNWFDWQGTLNPGDSIDFLLYQLTPNGGNAPAGTYQAFDIGLGLLVYGSNNTYGSIDADLLRMTTGCSPSTCSFTRTVVAAVPVPGALWLLGSAAAVLGLVRRRCVG